MSNPAEPDTTTTKILPSQIQMAWDRGHNSVNVPDGVDYLSSPYLKGSMLHFWFDVGQRYAMVCARNKELVAGITSALSAPCDMLLFCFCCLDQHVDEPHGEWTNPPHRSHQCQRCQWVWRQADFPTNGVRTIGTQGENDMSPHPMRVSLSIEETWQAGHDAVTAVEGGGIIMAECQHVEGSELHKWFIRGAQHRARVIENRRQGEELTICRKDFCTQAGDLLTAKRDLAVTVGRLRLLEGELLAVPKMVARIEELETALVESNKSRDALDAEEVESSLKLVTIRQSLAQWAVSGEGPCLTAERAAKELEKFDWLRGSHRRLLRAVGNVELWKTRLAANSCLTAATRLAEAEGKLRAAVARATDVSAKYDDQKPDADDRTIHNAASGLPKTRTPAMVVAWDFAVDSARRHRPTYLVEPFIPHGWVIDAIMRAMDHVRQATACPMGETGGCDNPACVTYYSKNPPACPMRSPAEVTRDHYKPSFEPIFCPLGDNCKNEKCVRYNAAKSAYTVRLLRFLDQSVQNGDLSEREVASLLGVQIIEARRLRQESWGSRAEPDSPASPGYYKVGGFELSDVVEALGLGFHLGNVLKYLWRAGRKDPARVVEDLEKAIVYIQRYIKMHSTSEKLTNFVGVLRPEDHIMIRYEPGTEVTHVPSGKRCAVESYKVNSPAPGKFEASYRLLQSGWMKGTEIRAHFENVPESDITV